MSSPFQKKFCGKSPLEIRKAASAKKNKPKKEDDTGYVKPKKVSKFMRKAGSKASGGGQDRDVKINK
tara:strand:+ start:756 stop:956 length:201 start_codon:yes stop_codon:yes gene_type:complete